MNPENFKIDFFFLSFLFHFVLVFPLNFIVGQESTSLRNFVSENWNFGHLRLNVVLHVYLLGNSISFQGRKY